MNTTTRRLCLWQVQKHKMYRPPSVRSQPPSAHRLKEGLLSVPDPRVDFRCDRIVSHQYTRKPITLGCHPQGRSPRPLSRPPLLHFPRNVNLFVPCQFKNVYFIFIYNLFMSIMTLIIDLHMKVTGNTREIELKTKNRENGG